MVQEIGVCKICREPAQSSGTAQSVETAQSEGRGGIGAVGSLATKVGVKAAARQPQLCLLRENETLPVIINSELEMSQDEKLIKELKKFYFLEAKFLQDRNHTPSIEEQIELEALSKSKLFNTQGLSDEEIEAEIMTWCKRREHMIPDESCKLPNPKGLPSQCKLPSPRTEEKLIQLEIRPPKLELKPLPVNINLEKGVKPQNDPKRNLNVVTRKDWNARFDDAFPEEYLHAAQFVKQGSLDAPVGEVVEAKGAAEPVPETVPELEEAPDPPPAAKPARTPRTKRGR